MHYFPPFYSPYGPFLFGVFLPLVVALFVWTIVIKGYALWHAARLGQRNWFIALLVLNTVGILDLVYLVWYRKGSTPAHHSSTQA